LTTFGDITGLDPLSLGASERVAADLGITSAQALAMEQIAHDQLAASVPEPSSYLMMIMGVFGLAWLRKRPGHAA
jgi:hypothetical protein